MTPIGSQFPPEYLDSFVERAIQPGSVLRFHVEFTTPPKVKRLVVLSRCDNSVCVGFMLINSEINPNIFRNDRLRRLHLPLFVNHCSFLDHDSFLDCSDIKEMTLEEMKDLIRQDASRHLGNLDDGVFQSAVALLKEADTIKTKIKRKYNLL
jgi:hypothetical protein